MRKYWLYIFIVIQLLIIGSLLKSIISTVGSGKRVEELLLKKEGLVAKKKQLTDGLSSLESEFYLEKVAREQLHLVMPGETVVMLPQNSSAKVENPPKQIEERRVWQKWVQVFWNEQF